MNNYSKRKTRLKKNNYPNMFSPKEDNIGMLLIHYAYQ